MSDFESWAVHEWARMRECARLGTGSSLRCAARRKRPRRRTPGPQARKGRLESPCRASGQRQGKVEKAAPARPLTFGSDLPAVGLYQVLRHGQADAAAPSGPRT